MTSPQNPQAFPKNPQAFPMPHGECDHGRERMCIHPNGGMTLRDYFAAKVAAAMVSTIHNEDDYVRAVELAKLNDCERVSDWFAKEAYKQADALLKARGSAQ